MPIGHDRQGINGPVDRVAAKKKWREEVDLNKNGKGYYQSSQTTPSFAPPSNTNANKN